MNYDGGEVHLFTCLGPYQYDARCRIMMLFRKRNDVINRACTNVLSA